MKLRQVATPTPTPSPLAAELASIGRNDIPAALLIYQQEWIADDSPLKIAEKSRRIGLTWAEAADNVLIASAEGRFGATREDIRLHLESTNIEARAVWKPMHLQPVFRDLRVVGGSVSEHLFEYGLCLPSGSNLTDEDKGRVVRGVLSTPRGAGR